MDYLASMYIDNEMDLVEKRQFVELVRFNQSFYTLALELLDQEQLLRQLACMPAQAYARRRRRPMRSILASLFNPLGFAAAGFVTAFLIVNLVSWPSLSSTYSQRFVIFEPAADRVDLTGSFTKWQPVAMQRIGNSGYWELKLNLPAGEHRFAYILDGDDRMVDPTLPTAEPDDFGGENSIISVEG